MLFSLSLSDSRLFTENWTFLQWSANGQEKNEKKCFKRAFVLCIWQRMLWSDFQRKFDSMCNTRQRDDIQSPIANHQFESARFCFTVNLYLVSVSVSFWCSILFLLYLFVFFSSLLPNHFSSFAVIIRTYAYSLQQYNCMEEETSTN